jgi:hypothetical protein
MNDILVPEAAGRGVRYLHGGKPGLKAGDQVLPPAETGAETLGSILRETDPYESRLSGRSFSRPDVVYVATDLEVAAGYATLWTLSPFHDGDGAVYEVRPSGEVVPDPHARMGWADGECWMCPRAAVTRIVATAPYWKVIKLPDSRDKEQMLRQIHRARAEGRRIPEDSRAAWIQGKRLLNVAVGVHADLGALALRALGL